MPDRCYNSPKMLPVIRESKGGRFDGMWMDG